MVMKQPHFFPCTGFFLALILFLSLTIITVDVSLSDSVISPEDVATVVFVTKGNFTKSEKAALNLSQIKDKVVAQLKSAGIHSTLRDQKSGQLLGRFFKIRIHSIFLERQVYFCSAEIIEQHPPDEPRIVWEQTNVVSRAKDVGGVVNDFLEKLLREISVSAKSAPN